jgi:glutamate--cysteine ligase
MAEHLSHPPADAAREITDFEQLLEPFRSAEKPPSAWCIGAEAEKFGVDATTGAPIEYDGERGVLRVLEALAASHGWAIKREREEGPIVALERSRASITLEPGAQLELSGAPLPTVHAIVAELRGHLAELRDISSEMNLAWLGVGFHPLARQEDLPWVPKERYPIMKQYLPTRGAGAWDMMRRTATVQANFDYSSEEDALTKLTTLLRLAPVANAMLANSPFYEGRLSGQKSLRQGVWLRMDPSRSGLIPSLWGERDARFGYRDYVEWALDAGMFYVKREGRIVHNTGQTFRSFWKDGFHGERATLGDWVTHLNTLFPEIRLKRTLEVRCCDSLPAALSMAVPALFTGLLYDARALDEARELAFSLTLRDVQAAREALARDGLAARVGGRPARETALRMLDIAGRGLQRRAQLNAARQDESIYLRRLAKLTERGQSPADVLTEGLSAEDADLAVEAIARTRA